MKQLKSRVAAVLVMAVMLTLSLIPADLTLASENTNLEDAAVTVSVDATADTETGAAEETKVSDDEGAVIEEALIEEQLGTSVNQDALAGSTAPSVNYQAHVSKIGWQSTVSNGATAGTTGKSLAIEAIKISLSNLSSELKGSGVQYSTHVQSFGWQSAVYDGSMAGTVGLSKRVEAITISLTGAIAEKYDIYYRVHTQSYGWLGWAKNGEKAGTVGLSKRVEAIQIVLVEKGGQAPGSVSNCFKYSRISYQSHVQSYGWQSSVTENQISGTVGQSKRLEAIKLELSSELEYSGSIQYQVYVQSYGWMDWKSDGEIAGTVGAGKRIEAIRIRLTGEIANYYDVYYSVQMAKLGWRNYACNGEVTGTTNLSKRIEAIKVCLVRKGTDTAPATSGTKYVAGYSSSDFTYSAQILGAGSTGTVAQGATLGNTGNSQQLQNITLYLNSGSSTPSGTIRYATHVAKSGWTGWSTCGTASGSNNSSLGLEAVKFELTGDLATYYDIYYRVHVEKYGWLGWAKNGQVAGTTGIGYRLEAVQIVLVSKDAKAPGTNANYYKDKKVATKTVTTVVSVDAMQSKAQQYSSSTSYLILVDRDNHKVGIFSGSQGAWSYVYKWDCTNGKASTPTVAGVFTVQNKGYYFDSGSSRCYWWTQFYGNYLFHSVLYTKSGQLQDGRLGMALSHGCVRLAIENAKWIYDNIPKGTTVVVY